jgi:SPX domain protein involved in polyphosphate accumulation
MIGKELMRVECFYTDKVEEFGEQMLLLREQTHNSLGQENDEPAHTKLDEKTSPSMDIFMQPSLSNDTITPSADRVEKGNGQTSTSSGKDGECKQVGGKKKSNSFESLKRALVALHRDSNQLRNYTILNYTACVKIIKKYDKTLQVLSTRLLCLFLPTILVVKLNG